MLGLVLPGPAHLTPMLEDRFHHPLIAVILISLFIQPQPDKKLLYVNAFMWIYGLFVSTFGPCIVWNSGGWGEIV